MNIFSSKGAIVSYLNNMVTVIQAGSKVHTRQSEYYGKKVATVRFTGYWIDYLKKIIRKVIIQIC